MTRIKFNELLDYEKHPTQGKHNFFSSKVLDLEFFKDEVKYYVKCYVDINYSRWVYPETCWSPKEDECEIIKFQVESIKGIRYHNDEEIILSEKDLRKLQLTIENEIIFE